MIQPLDRRTFLKTSATVVASAALSRALGAGEANDMNRSELPRRPYARTNTKLSIIGLGGIVLMGHPQSEANEIVAGYVEKGGNYFDVAPTYGNGEAEEKLGPALEPYRKNSFLACKTTQRQREGAEKEFATSLDRLKTDYFDLYQLHAITDVQKDVDAAFARGGVMEMIAEKRKAGQIRHVGFSAHSVEAAIEAFERYDFDSALFPVNFACYYNGQFGPQVLETAAQKGASVLALKTGAMQRWPADHPLRSEYPKAWYLPITDPQQIALALRWSLSQQAVAAAVPPGDVRLWREAVTVGLNYTPVTAEELAEVKAWARKTPPLFAFDGTLHGEDDTA